MSDAKALVGDVAASQLGKTTVYPQQYDAGLLFPIPRQTKRDELAIDAQKLPFTGVDVWNAYEISWLNLKGKPMVAMGQFTLRADTPNIIESKSFKLYLNSFNASRFDSQAVVAHIMERDLSAVAGGKVKVQLSSLNQEPCLVSDIDRAECLDFQDLEIDTYQVNPDFLRATNQYAEEAFYSHLLKSNCLVTGQPDWGTVVIRYRGPKIDRAGLLRYIISFRDHNEFHEQCVERMFCDIQRQCQPDALTVYARYVRRGGLDINPFRSNFQSEAVMPRLVRQ